MNKLFDGAFFIAVFTAILFSTSSAYMNAYYNSLGIESGFIDKNPYTLLFYSAFLLLEPVSVAFIISFILLSMLSIGLQLYRNRHKSIKKRSIKFSKSNGIEPRTTTPNNSTSNPFDMLLNRVFLIFVLVASFYGLLVYAEDRAHTDVRKIIEQVKLCEYNDSKLIYTTKYENPMFIITCGENNCAGIDVEHPYSCQNWKNKKFKIVYFENKAGINNFYNYAK